MLNLKTGKNFAEAPMTRRNVLTGLGGIIATGCAPSIALGAARIVSRDALAGSANASVGRGMMRNVGARNAAMFGEVDDPYANTYLHFDGRSQFKGFKPTFVDGVTEFTAIGDVAAIYPGNYNNVYCYDSSYVMVANNSKNFSLSIYRQNAKYVANFKMNGNNMFANAESVVVDSKLLNGVFRFKLECGLKSFSSGSLACYYSYNNNLLARGQDVDINMFGYLWNNVTGQGVSPSIGWCAIQHDNVDNSGKPSIFDLYSLEFTQSGAVTNRLVPAIRTDNVPCLWDEITNKRIDWTAVYYGGEITLHGPAKYVGV